MVKRLAFGVVVLLGFAASARAQQGDPAKNYDFEKPLYTVVDKATKGYFGGWSGNCNTGRIPIAFTLTRTDLVTKEIVFVPITVYTGPRADAAAWLAATCNHPFDVNVGWSIVPVDPEPPGQFQYVVFVTDMPASWTCGVYPAGYPNAGQMWCDYVSNAVYRIVQDE